MAAPKLTLSASRDIPFNKLVLSQSNVRQIKTGVSIEELAEDIARRTLLQSLSVRSVLDEEGAETGMFEVPAGGRRYRALELLVKQKRLSKTALIPCVLRTAGMAEEDSLAENVQRAPLHPLDQFRAFKTLRRQRSRRRRNRRPLFRRPCRRQAAAAPCRRLREAAHRLRRGQDDAGALMAFTVSADHARQEQVWDALARSYSRERLSHPAAVDPECRPGERSSRDLRRARRLSRGGRRHPQRSLQRRSRRLAAGIQRCSTGSPGRSSSRTLRPCAPRAGNGSSSRRHFPLVTTIHRRRLAGEPIPPTAEEETANEAIAAEREGVPEAQYGDADEIPDDASRRIDVLDETIANFEDRPRAPPRGRGRAGRRVWMIDDAMGRLLINAATSMPRMKRRRRLRPLTPMGKGRRSQPKSRMVWLRWFNAP